MTQYTTERYRAAVQYGELNAGAPLTARAADLRLMHGVGSAHASPAVLHAHAFHPLHAHVVHAAREWQKLAALLHCAAPMAGLLHAGLRLRRLAPPGLPGGGPSEQRGPR